jgi:serine/threonine protein kinase
MSTPVERAFYTVLAKGYLGEDGAEPSPECLEVVARQLAEWCKAEVSDLPEEERAGKVLQGLVLLSPEDEEAIIHAAVEEAAGGRSEQARQALTRLLGQVRSSIRQACRDPLDPSGRTISRRLRLHGAEGFLSVLPGRAARFRPGDRPAGIGDWVLEELLGVGGFGEVWKARHETLGTVRALKFCLDPTAAALLRHEGTLLARVMREAQHDGIVRLHNSYLSVATPCLEYDHVAGGNLASYARQFPEGMPAGEVLRRITELVDILATVHGLPEPIVHRDLKPANILLQPDGQGDFRLRVADFGIAQVAARLAAQVGGNTSPHAHQTWLRGAHTPLYASPEQQRPDSPPVPSDDIHALGVIWYQLLIGDLGVPAPTGRRWQDVLRRRSVSDRAIALLEECFERRGERPDSAVVLRERLRGVGAPVAPRRPELVPVREVEVPPLAEIRIEPVRIAQAPPSPLPPLPEAILELEGELAGIERPLRALTDGLHPSLAAGQQALRHAEEQVRQAEAEIAPYEGPVPQPAREQILAALNRGETSPAELARFAGPETSLDAVLPYLLQLRNVRKAQESLATARGQFEQQRQERVATLQQAADETRGRLIRAQQEDFEGLLIALLEQTRGDEFPLDHWIELQPHLTQRRYRFADSEVDLLACAERFFRDQWSDERAWRQAQRSGDPKLHWEYLAKFPAGRHASEARQAVAEKALVVALAQSLVAGVVAEKVRQREEQDWQDAREENTVAAYEAYLAAHVTGAHAAEARAALAELKAEAQEERTRQSQKSDEADWRMAEQSSTADSYEEYLAYHPHGTHQREAKERLTTLLRRQVIEHQDDTQLRVRYLKHRTPEQKEQDARHNTSIDLYMPPILVAVLFAVLAWLSWAVVQQDGFLHAIVPGQAARIAFVIVAFAVVGIGFLAPVVLLSIAMGPPTLNRTFESSLKGAIGWGAIAGLGVAILLHGAGLDHERDVSWWLVVRLALEVLVGGLLGLCLTALQANTLDLEGDDSRRNALRRTCMIVGLLVCPAAFLISGSAFAILAEQGVLVRGRGVALVLLAAVVGILFRSFQQTERRQLGEEFGPLPWILDVARKDRRKKYLGE